jgi:hypothetical protein
MVRQYVGAAQFVGEKIIKPIAKKIFKKQKTTGTEVVQPFKFKPAKSKLEKVVKDLQISTAKESGKIKKYIQKMESDIEPFRRKLRQTTQKLDKKPVTESGFNKGKDLEKKAKGGRVGLKRGTGLKRKSNVQKIQEAFGPKQKPQSRMTRKKKFPDLTGDGKVTFADILKGRGVINGKKKTKRFV